MIIIVLFKPSPLHINISFLVLASLSSQLKVNLHQLRRKDSRKFGFLKKKKIYMNFFLNFLDQGF